MTATAMERVWVWIHATFPERQIYIRSDGRVQFFTFGPSLQATLAGLTLIFLGWVAFATVNVIFKDRIITAKDHRYQEMQSAYENRLADLQISYDELNGALVRRRRQIQGHRRRTSDQAEYHHQFPQSQGAGRNAIGPGRDAGAVPMQTAPALGGSALDDGPASDSLEVSAPAQNNFGGDADAGSTLPVMPGPAAAPAAHGQARPCQPAGGRLRKIAQDGVRRIFSPHPKKPRRAFGGLCPASGFACAVRTDGAGGIHGKIRKPADGQDDSCPFE